MLKYLLVFLSVISTQAQFLSNGRGGSGGGAAPLAASIYYVSVNGNDTTAVAGDATKAYAKLSAAVSNAVNNSVIYVMPDTQVVTPYLVREPDIDSLATAGTVNFINKTNITIRGPGSIIYGAGQGNLMIIKDSDNITLDGLTFHGNRPTTNAVCVATNYGHVFIIGGCDDINFKNCTFKEFGQYAICSTDNVNESANDNINKLSVTGCSFKNGGATNVVGLYSKGGAIGARARVLAILDSSFDNIAQGVLAYNQVNLGAGVSTNTTIRIIGNTFNKVWEGLFISKMLTTAFTNDQTVTFSGNTATDIGLNYPNNIGDPTSYGLLLFATKKATVIGNTFAGNYNFQAVGLASQVRRASLTFIGNTVKNALLGVYTTQYASTLWVDGCTISGNTFDNIGANAIFFQGRNSVIADNSIFSASTNSAPPFGEIGQIAISGNVSGQESTNIIVKGNNFTDNVEGLPGSSVIFSASTNCFAVRFEDNTTGARLSSVTNNYIQHFGTGSVKHRYRFASVNNTASVTHQFPLTNGYSGIFIAKAIANGVITGTNWNYTAFTGAGMQHYSGVINLNTTGTQITPIMLTTLTGHALTGSSLDISSIGGAVTPRLKSGGAYTINWLVDVEYSMLR